MARPPPAMACGGRRIDDLLDALVRGNFIRRFEIDGRPFGVIRNFVKFQRPKKPADLYPFTADQVERASVPPMEEPVPNSTRLNGPRFRRWRNRFRTRPG